MQIGEGSVYFVLITMKQLSFQISLFLAVLTLIGCHRPPEFPEIPQIGFERLHLSDTSTLILNFNVTDGDGDIGLDPESNYPNDSFEPYHAFGIIVENDEIVTLSGEYSGPFNIVPAALFPVTYTIFKGLDDDGRSIFERETVLEPFRVGEEIGFSPDDSRPSTGFECEEYEIISFYHVEQEMENDLVVSETLVEEVDTVFVERNPYHLNIYIDLLIKTGDDYIPFEFDDCDPGYSARFPVFDRSDFGRPLDGSISYTFFSTQFATENSFILTETLRLRFYIYDRALNQSNVITTEDFTLLGLRTKDLIGN